MTDASAVRTMFDRIAPTYDVLNRVMSAGTDARWRKRAVRLLAPRVREGGAVLDSCAGTMDLTALLARELPRRRIVACDFAAQMLERGRAKAKDAEVVVGDALALPFADGEFEGMICGFGMRNLADLDQGIREARRVLAPGGVFVTLEFFRPKTLRARAFHASYARHVLPAIGGLLSGDRAAYDYLQRSMDAFVSREEYERALARAGFVGVRGEDLTMGVAAIVRAEVPW